MAIAAFLTGTTPCKNNERPVLLLLAISQICPGRGVYVRVCRRECVCVCVWAWACAGLEETLPCAHTKGTLSPTGQRHLCRTKETKYDFGICCTLELWYGTKRAHEEYESSTDIRLCWHKLNAFTLCFILCLNCAYSFTFDFTLSFTNISNVWTTGFLKSIIKTVNINRDHDVVHFLWFSQFTAQSRRNYEKRNTPEKVAIVLHSFIVFFLSFYLFWTAGVGNVHATVNTPVCNRVKQQMPLQLWRLLWAEHSQRQNNPLNTFANTG